MTKESTETNAAIISVEAGSPGAAGLGALERLDPATGELVLLDPARVGRESAANEAAARYAARNGALDEAIARLDDALLKQRAFVLWWDAQGKDVGGGNVSRGPRAGDRYVTGRDFAELPPDLSTKQVSRWRKALVVKDDPSDDSLIAKARAAARDKVRKWAGFETPANHSSESVEWYTPRKYIEPVRDLFDGVIDLDPASCAKANETVGADNFFSIDDDGLAQEWRGRVFFNPPYGTDGGESVAGRWVRKSIEEYRAGRALEVVGLVNSLHSQAWQAPIYDWPICLVDHRIQFVSGDGTPNANPTMSNLFFYLGRRVTRFFDAFNSIGYCMMPGVRMTERDLERPSRRLREPVRALADEEDPEDVTEPGS